MSGPAEARDRLKVGFSAVAREYLNGRPSYSPEYAAAILDGLGPTPRAVDVGAGSGQLARPLARAGARVTAVEPLATARAVLAEVAAAEQVAVAVVDGGAEALPVGDADAEVVTCADSFHWFDPELAVSEFCRVLRPGGRVCISRLEPAWTEEQSGRWALEVGAVIGPIWVAAGHPLGAERDPTAQLTRSDLEPVRHLQLTVSHATDRDGLIDYFGSISVIAVLPDDERGAVRAQIARILDTHQVGQLELDYRAELWMATRR